MNILKPLANTITLTTANTINDASLVFVAAATNTALLSITDDANTVISSFVLPVNQYVFVEKRPTYKLSSNATVFATSAAFRG